MTEADWLAAGDPKPMLSFLRGKARERKFRLFACACCRRIDHLLRDERSRRGIEVVEQFHDGKIVHQAYAVAEKAASDAQAALFRAVDALEGARGVPFGDGVRTVAELFAAQAVVACFGNTGGDAAHGCSGALRGFATAEIDDDARSRDVGDEVERAESAVQAALVRDIFGNPFRPVVFAPEWRTSTAVAIAQGMSESRDFSGMPILADALQDVGCDSEDVLQHCRDEKATHVRGCWVVDLVLGKS